MVHNSANPKAGPSVGSLPCLKLEEDSRPRFTGFQTTPGTRGFTGWYSMPGTLPVWLWFAGCETMPGTSAACAVGRMCPDHNQGAASCPPSAQPPDRHHHRPEFLHSHATVPVSGLAVVSLSRDSQWYICRWYVASLIYLYTKFQPSTTFGTGHKVYCGGWWWVVGWMKVNLVFIFGTNLKTKTLH